MNDLQNLFLGALGYFLGMVATTPKLGPEAADRLLTTAEHDGIAGLLADLAAGIAPSDEEAILADLRAAVAAGNEVVREPPSGEVLLDLGQMLIPTLERDDRVHALLAVERRSVARRLVAAAVAIGVDVERLATRLGVEPNGPQTTFAIEDAAARWEIGGAP